MWPDQAAGLRPAGRALVLLSRRPEAAAELALALNGQGRSALIVACAPPAGQVRTLHGWRQQLKQGALEIGSRNGCAWLDAAGAAAGEPVLVDAVRGWDWLVFDAGWPAALPLAGAAMQVVVEVAGAGDASSAYAWFKALRSAGVETGLVGPEAVRVVDAARRFLGAEVVSSAHSGALAARMAAYDNDTPSGIRRLAAP